MPPAGSRRRRGTRRPSTRSTWCGALTACCTSRGTPQRSEHGRPSAHEHLAGRPDRCHVPVATGWTGNRALVPDPQGIHALLVAEGGARLVRPISELSDHAERYRHAHFTGSTSAYAVTMAEH